MRMNLIQNNRGDIPVTILVIGVFSICTILIISFIFSGNQLLKTENELGVELIEQANIIAEQIRFYQNAGEDPLMFVDGGILVGGEYIIELKDSNGNIVVYKIKK